jgi:hypothetical protein
MSPQRVDYYDSPEAPKANSLAPSVNVVVVDDAARNPLNQQRRGTPGVLHRLTTRPLGGQPTPSSKSSEVRWDRRPASEPHSYRIDRSMRIRISDFLTPGKSPVVSWGGVRRPGWPAS